MLYVVALTVSFLFLSGLAAAVDAAVLSVTHPEVEELVSRRKWGGRRLRWVKQHLTQSVVVIVIVTNTINVLGPIVVSRQASQLGGVEAMAMITAVLALGTIVFSEIIPKSLGAHYAPLIARLSAPAIRWLRILLYPLVITLAAMSRLFTRGSREIGTEEQIRSLVRLGDLAGHIESDEGKLIHRVFVLNDKTAGQIMTPIEHTKAISLGSTIAQAAAEVVRSQYSRYPVFGQSLDETTGILLSRDILTSVAEDRRSESVASLVRTAPVVPASMKSDELMLELRKARVHLGIVRDSGKTVGIVTLEDVLEELVGEIEDEKDYR